MYKLGTQLFLISVAFLFFAQPHAKAQFQPEPPVQHEDPADYSESALRRFEIVTLSSLPFTAIHSYLVVRGIKMYRENIFAPELTPSDYRMVGIGAVSLSLFIGVWDWLHTRNVDRSAPRVPEPKAPPVEEEDPVEGTIARLSETDPHTARYKEILRQNALNNRLNRWANDPAIGFAVPLLQVRF
ncbi:hypothetical protein F4Z99_20425 [Candidatus Poribacteria bacterium]|nr:hypothetical protein [Candidatus Poribacteria bacterium]MYB00032.1 hypothetical protein [Candidatus Poribacteria bacterium]